MVGALIAALVAFGTVGASAYSLSFPKAINGVAVNTIGDAIRTTAVGSSMTVGGFLALDGGACGHSIDGPDDCTGAFVWERSVPDPDYGGSRLALVGADAVKRLTPALGIRDWGLPVVVSGVIVDSVCNTDWCGAKLRLDALEWQGQPVPDRLPTQPLDGIDALAKRVPGTLFKLPQSWHVDAVGPGWELTPAGADAHLSVSKRPDRVIFDASRGGVVDAFPDGRAIAYEYGKDLVVWLLEKGRTAETRQTLLGYDDGTATYELTLDWLDAGIWAGASRLMIDTIASQMPVDQPAAE
jgi:hypothetical protein